MLTFVIKRLLQAIPTLLALITLSFFVMRLAPGNPFLSEECNLSQEAIAHIEAKYGFDKPLYQQYLRYLNCLLHGDLGPSLKYKDFSVNELVYRAFPVSLKIGLYAFVFAVCFGVSIGVTAALWKNSWVDYLVMTLAMVGVIMPNFVKAPLFILCFSLWLRWLPAGGWHDGALLYLILPVVTLAISYIASIARITRSSMIEVLHSPFIRTAHAKGLPMRSIVWRHALKPALLPVISYLGPAFVGVITGSIVIESLFCLPGLGQLFVNGAINRDYSLVLGLTILIGVLTILFNAVIDILYACIDPRIRY